MGNIIIKFVIATIFYGGYAPGLNHQQYIAMNVIFSNFTYNNIYRWSSATALGQLPAMLLAFCCGACLTLAFSPFNMIFVVPISLTILLILLDKQGERKFLLGFVFGYGHFLTSLYWMVYSILGHFTEFIWVVPFVLILLPSVLALFTGLGVIAAERFRYHKVLYVFAFSMIWVICEALRSYLILPFPWNLIGYTANSSIYLLQISGLIGIHCMSFVMCLFGTCFFSRNIKLISALGIFFLCIYAYGYCRIEGARFIYYDDYTFKIVQPNFTEHHFGNPQKQYEDFLKLFEMSIGAEKSDISKTVVVWPEAAFPFWFDGSLRWKAILANIVPKGGYLIMGTDRIEGQGDVDDTKVYNSIVVLDAVASELAVYDKMILVPFGEYIPMRAVLPGFIQKIVYGLGDFSHGKSIKPIRLGGKALGIVPLICYESIFPFLISSYNLKDIGVLLNLTNNAWFGDSIGPAQHLAMTRMRAVEFGISMLSVSNTGETALFNPFGEVIGSIPHGSQGVVDMKIPMPMLSFHAKYPHLQLLWLVLISIAVILFHRCRKV